MEPLAATAVLLFLLGAVASGYCFGRLLGNTSGCAVALFYLIVLLHVSTDNGFSVSVSQAGNIYYQRAFKTVLLVLGGVILVEFIRNQLRRQPQQLEQRQQHEQKESDTVQFSTEQQQQRNAADAAGVDAVAHPVHCPTWYKQRCEDSELLQVRGSGYRRHSSSSGSKGSDFLQLEPELLLSGSPAAASLAVYDCDEDEEVWRMLPDAVFMEVYDRLSCASQGAMRAVCTHWCDAGKRTITRLRPSQLPAKNVGCCFPSLKALDLSGCTKDITPVKLRQLRCLPGLEDVTLGCHHRLIASTITDNCIAELVVLTRLSSLNLSQCVHVGDGGLMSLVYLTRLRSLNISGCVAVTDLGVMLVAQLTNLTSLDMPWCVKVTNIGLKALTPLTKLANLNISGCQLITEQGVKCLSAFTNLERLSLLNMGYSKVCVTDAALEQLAGLSKLRSLNLGSMQLSNKLVTDDSMRRIASSHRELTQLGLMSLDISDTGVAQLAQLTQLQALNLRGCARVSSGCLKYLSVLTRLTDLCLLHNSRLDMDDACLASLAKLPNLQILGLGNFQASASASDTCLVPLAASKHLLVLSVAFFTGRFGPETCGMLSRMSLLQHLDLQGSQHADATLLQAVGQISTLQSLHLSRCCQIDDAALQHITGLSNLHTLNISICSKVTDMGLAAVTKLHSLTHLLAQQCRDVTDAGVALLGRLTKLQVLDLSLCERITGSGFATFGGCRQMATLSLNGCASLNDGGLRAIGRIVSLTKLDLSNCQLITDVGVVYLRGLGELTGLDLALCIRVGDGAMAAIASSMHQLATIKVNGCVRITDLGVSEVCGIPSLLTLHLDRCVQITDLGLQCLTRLTGLTSLRISRCPNVTDAGVAQLSRLSRLSTLSLAQCPRVTDAGLMALAPLTTLASLEF
ncbi:hypothetical protein COO60DRAFT_1628532 [Scenedesmus sp. NREL 46B-D3]|nr:hypothetical protein COO60DRAFT_1628532 [Scenedesmus sp. NREL 46B-D3]